MNTSKTIIIVLLVAIVMIYNSISLAPFDSKLFDVGSVIVLVVFCIYIRYCRKNQLADCWLKPSNLFLIGFFAVNLQYIVDYRIGLKGNDSTLITEPQTLNHCLVIGIAGFLAFVLGYIWKSALKSNPSKCITFIPSQKPPTFFVILHVLMFCLFILTINISDFLLGSAFVGETKQSPFEGLFYLSTMLLVLFVSRQELPGNSLVDYFKSFPKINLICIVLYMLLRMFSGDRGPMIYTGMLLMYGYIVATKTKWRLSVVLPLLIVGSLFVSLIGMSRVGNLNESFFDRIINSYTSYTTSGRFGESGERSVFTATEELGFSFLVNQTDVKAIKKDGESFHYGMFQLYSLLVAVPYMPSFLDETLKIPEDELSSVGFADKHFFDNQVRTWSLGTTLVGDFYLELGILGVIVGLFFCGKLFRFIDYSIFITPSSQINIFLLYLVLHFASQAIYMPRSVLLLNLQKVFLGFILIYFYKKVLARTN